MSEVIEDLEAIKASLALLTSPGQVFEIRAINERKFKSVQGFFDDHDTAAELINRLSDDYKGIYVTLNPVEPELLHRANNRFKTFQQELGAHDKEILRRRWLPVDIDPKRLAGISSTRAEHKAACQLARVIADTMGLVYGFPDPIISSSGNGAHLLYAMDEDNSDEIRDTVKGFIASLRVVFGSVDLDIDTSVFNASRIWRLYGTVARKGDDTLERPHRLAKVLRSPVLIDNVDLDSVNYFIKKNGINLVKTKTSVGLYESAYPKDEGEWRVLNRAALERISEWVPDIFGEDARRYNQGYRISSLALNRDKEEDLTIHPWPRGIKDFGEHDSGENEEGRRTPISVIAEQNTGGNKEQAAEWLSNHLGLTKSEFAKVAAKHGNDVEKDEFDAVFKKGSKTNFDYKAVRTAQSLLGQDFKELTWLVEEMIPEGAFFLTSRPKMRKSWLVLQLAIAVASGGTFLDKKVAQGEVLGLFLEENDRRLKRRIDTLFTFNKVPNLDGFHYWAPGSLDFDEYFPRGSDGCDVIGKWLEDHPKCKLVIIDTFAHFRGHETGRNQNVYQLDYDAVMPITRLCAKHQVTCIIVHHERKEGAKETADFIENTSGSTGLTGGVDGIMSIRGKRGPTDENEVRTLAITGRDVVHDWNLNMAFDAELGGWRLAKQKDVQDTIMQILKKYTVMKISEIYAAVGQETSQSRVRQVLLDMRHQGVIESTANGYKLAPM